MSTTAISVARATLPIAVANMVDDGRAIRVIAIEEPVKGSGDLVATIEYEMPRDAADPDRSWLMVQSFSLVPLGVPEFSSAVDRR